ncbi:NAD(P)/FAD-dependent oxidoreductase [Candidatus Parcubacteria bacterium]|nr:NAD(P)/FAD-dependent oxidoreductase [Candidatus Parcubacteria bacterium]
MKEKYDIVVVGAGPAGSMTAKTAAKNGLEVLLMEKKMVIGHPVQCAEAVGKGLEKFLNIKSKWVAQKIKGSYMYFPDGTRIVMPQGNKTGYVLERKIFDRDLAMQAARAGAKVRIGTKAEDLLIENGFVKGVKGISFGKKFEVFADIVIGTDGVGSKVGRWAGIDTSTEIMPCAQFLLAGIEIDSGYSEFYLGEKIAPGGYAWVFPKGEGVANVGLGFPRERAEQGLTVSDYLKRFIRKKFPEGQIIEKIPGAVPVAPIKKIVENGYMTAGDAAGQVDSLTGAGIRNAVEAGIMAAEVAAKAISKGDVSIKMLMEYQERWHNSKTGRDIIKMNKARKISAKSIDKDFNELGHSLKGVNLRGVSSIELLKILIRKNPKMLWKLRGLIKS